MLRTLSLLKRPILHGTECHWLPSPSTWSVVSQTRSQNPVGIPLSMSPRSVLKPTSPLVTPRPLLNPGLLSMSPTSSIFFEQKRFFWGNEGRIGWRRKWAKALRRREEILEPSSPVIDQRVPWPEDEWESLSLPSEDTLEGKDCDEWPSEVTTFRKNSILERINDQLKSNTEGRLFAVINISGRQFKVTPEDIIIIQGVLAPNIGDQLRFHKVLLLGSKDFTLVGRPLIENELVRVEATVIEKTLSYTKMHFRMKAKKNFRRLKFYKTPYTMLRINLLEMSQPLIGSTVSSTSWKDEPWKGKFVSENIKV
ncbi:unnamed protein product [Orchesella dallaii]|uniref:Large ribosomal subunit protein bL21m n=1 Tax=Orchesella dallaii TaxID=48710 RepID=A0ABP1R8P5_9HEXA